jgi:alpha-amylase
VDYFSVEQDYGTNEDFRRLVEEAHKRDIRVIIDLVLNHTSSKHPWFLSARDDENSPYREFYIWVEEYPGYANPWGGAAWHRSGYDYYYGVFWEGMPDLNKGVKPDALAVGEVWSSTEEVVKYIGDQIDVAFEFDTAQAMLESARLENRDPILRTHRVVSAQYPRNQFAPFLTNHDQERAMSQLRGEVGHARTAASLLLTGPGVPFLYYGEEIGHSGGKPDENIRTPMQWSDEEVAGFTSASGAWKAPQRDHLEVNVAAQTDDPDSLLSHYRRLIHARNQHEALRVGDWQEVQVQDEHVYAFLRHSDEETLLVLINLGGDPISEYSLGLESSPLSEGRASEVLTGAPVNPPTINANGGFDAYVPVAELAAYGTYIVQLR